MTEEEAKRGVEELKEQFTFATVYCLSNTLMHWRVVVYVPGSYTLDIFEHRTIQVFIKAFEARSWQVRTTGR